MVADSGVPLTQLKVDGGMVRNNLLMQFQADVVCTDVVRPRLIETTALGAAFAAGLSVGLVQDLTQLRNQIRPEKTWSPRRTPQEVAMLYSEWNRAVERTYDWE